MRYHIGDRFVLDGTIVEVKFINNKKAWLFPVEHLEDDDGQQLLPWCSVACVDEKGQTSDGRKIDFITKDDCGAV